MLFQLFGDGVHICLDFAVLGLHLLHPVGAFFEEAEDALFLFFHIKVLELCHKRSDHAAHFAEILGLDTLQSLLGEVRHLFLRADAIGHDCLRIGDIDLLGKSIDHLQLFRAEDRFLRFLLLYSCRRRCCLNGCSLRLSKRKGGSRRHFQICKRICGFRRCFLNSCFHFCSFFPDFVCHSLLLRDAPAIDLTPGYLYLCLFILQK